MAKAMYTFSNFPDDRKADVEQAIRKAGGEPCEHPDFPGEICFYSAKSRKDLQFVWVNVAKAARAPDLKLRGPIRADG
jgi:hypothetical protein